MLTLKLHVISCSNPEFVQDKNEQFSYACRFMLKTIEETSDKTYIEKFKQRFNMTDIEYRSTKTYVKSFIKKQETNRKKKLVKIDRKKAELKELLNKKYDKKRTKPLSKKELRSIHQLKEQIEYLVSTLDSEPVFGGKKNLQKLTHLHNKHRQSVIDLENKVEDVTQQTVDEIKHDIEKQTVKFKNQRIWSFNVIGEANEKGNRFFDFSKLNEGILIYKPKFGIKIEFKVKIDGSRKKDIDKLVMLANNKLISITMNVSNKSISLSFDDSKLNGWLIDEQERYLRVEATKQLGLDKEEESKLIKEIYKEYHEQLREKKMVDKIEGRVLSIDMNPSYLGVSVLQRDFKNEDTENGKQSFKILHTFCYSLAKLNKRIPKEATDIEREYITNKRKHEIKQMIIHLFNVVNHYKCYAFVIEDLEFEDSKVSEKASKEANRKTKNIWNRNLITGMIDKLTTKFGIELIKVNCAYSSFIGNITYRYYDPINSAIEIGRRGLYKFVKNCTGYPPISEEILNTLETVILNNGGDVSKLNVAELTWVTSYNLLKKYRWRGSLSRVTARRSMSTKKSCVNILYC